MKQESLAGTWQFRQAGSREWLPAQVPGGVHTDLLALGLIPDPFTGDNEKRVQWVAEKDWVYQLSFSVSPEMMQETYVFLVCDGLDTFARVELNGQLVGECENMFRQYRWDVKRLLKEGENLLSITFASTVGYITHRESERQLSGVGQAIPGGPWARKAPCQFGWDWGPMLPPIGIWKDIRLEGYSTARLEDVHLRQQHQAGRVTLDTGIRLERWQPGSLSLHLAVISPDGQVWALNSLLSTDCSTLSLVIDHPQLWWPNGYGSQPLYQVEINLYDDGQLLDSRQYHLGLRKLELLQAPDEWGASFTFVVNDVPIFAKGSNWIPADSFPTRITDQHLGFLLSSAAASHQNMLRVWGGGFYEDDRFYAACDLYGILVWQDMIFACSIYPLNNPAFLENVRIEVEQNVRRLRHHASLALWCGNNEMETGWESWGWSRPDVADLKAAYETFYYHTLPAWISPLDPDHAYWPSSPSSNTPFKDANGQAKGDAHYWDVWHGRKPFTAYREQYPRFMSEFGFQSLPPFRTIQAYASQPDWNMTSYIMEHHQRSWNGNGLMIAQMTDTFRMPKDFESLVYISMLLQAEGIRFGVEHWRRNKRRVSGTLYWQLNDCWPVASWSSLDYFGRWKALHYSARHFFTPVLLSIEDAGMRMAVHVTSDLPQPWQGSLRWTLVTLSGEVLQSGTNEVRLEPLASVQVCAPGFNLNEEQTRRTIFVAELLQDGERLSYSLATFVPTKHLELADPRMEVAMHPSNGWVEITVVARTLARFVELSFTGADVLFSDNYFDIPAGWTVSVTCQLPQGWSLEQAAAALQVKSLFDSF
jgi:beta-mannosidase